MVSELSRGGCCGRSRVAGEGGFEAGRDVPVGVGGKGPRPGPLVRLDVFGAGGEGLCGGVDGLLQRAVPALLVRRGSEHHGRGVAVLQIPAEFRHVVEIREHLIVLALGEGVVFVVVAAGAAEGDSQSRAEIGSVGRGRFKCGCAEKSFLRSVFNKSLVKSRF